MILVDMLGKIMNFLYNLFNNYGIAIILFTILSKIILLPVSILVQKNSIKMVKMQPEINRININYYGDKDKIADEQTKLYKKEKYNAFTSLIPLFVQIVLLLALVEVINKPLTYIAKIDNEKIEQLNKITIKNNNIEEDSSIQLYVVKDIKNNKYLEEYSNILGENSIAKVKDINLKFLCFDLSWIAVNEKKISIFIPIIAALSALIMCIFQNVINVLQTEQSVLSKYGMLILSVGLSLYLGFFVPAGVALYWTVSNLLAILLQWLLNIFIDPKKAVDYDALKQTRSELSALNKIHTKRSKKQIIKERKDYKRFFKVVNKHLVFYSESNGFYKYFKGIIEYILENTNITIHYITSDYNDNIFNLEKENNQIKAYYIEEKKLITLMMKMDADVVVMTMPDLNNYHIKRSYVRKNIKYVFINHGMDSINLTYRPKALNAFDVVYLVDKYQREEMEKLQKLYKIKNQKLVDVGYSLLDEMILNYKDIKQKKPYVLLAPSWQKDNIMDLCLEQVLDELKKINYDVYVRPHPQYVRHKKERINSLKEKYKNCKNIIFETDFSSNDRVLNASVVITDWSSIANEFSYSTKKPVIFIDTPMKIMNPDYKDIKIEPINIWIREKIGKLIKLNELNKINNTVIDMIENQDKYKKEINKFVNDSIYNLKFSSEVGGNYIIELISEQIKERKSSND